MKKKHMLHRLIMHVCKLRRENRRIRALAAGEMEKAVTIERVELGKDGFDMVFKTQVAGLWASMMAQWLKDLGAENYAESRVTHDVLGEFILTLQKASGKTPHELRRQAETERDQLKEAAQAALDWFRSFGYNAYGIAVEGDCGDHEPIIAELAEALQRNLNLPDAPPAHDDWRNYDKSLKPFREAKH